MRPRDRAFAGARPADGRVGAWEGVLACVIVVVLRLDIHVNGMCRRETQDAESMLSPLEEKLLLRDLVVDLKVCG